MVRRSLRTQENAPTFSISSYWTERLKIAVARRQLLSEALHAPRLPLQRFASGTPSKLGLFLVPGSLTHYAALIRANHTWQRSVISESN